MLGVDPSSWTYHGLQRAAESRIEFEWWHTAQLMAAVYNGSLPRKDKQMWIASDFHPMARKRVRATLSASDVHSYKSMCKTHTKVNAADVRVRE
jgi:hypothetical protein